MNKKIIVTSLVIVALASSGSFASSMKNPLSEAPSTETKEPIPLTQRPLTLPFNKISDDIVRNYEARRKIAIHNENKQLQASRERFKKEPTYILRGKV